MAERQNDICDVPGVLVGHDTDTEAATGCTVVLFERPALGAVDVRGGAPGTRETDLLDSLNMMREVHAVLLTGGSAFGLDAATGVMHVLAERGIGFDAGPARVPIVPAAVLFDLGIGRPDVRPDAAAGARATMAATSGAVPQGSVGAGTGATFGKRAGPAFAVKGGIGSASLVLPDGTTVGALVAVNALGDVFDAESGQLVAGARSPQGTGWLAGTLVGMQPRALPSQPVVAPPFPGTQTTLALVVTDAPLEKPQLARIALMAHDGLARAIRPVHTPFDGDTVFALSLPPAGAPSPTVAAADLLALTLLGEAAAQAVAQAIVNAVRAATTLAGVPALRDLPFS